MPEYVLHYFNVRGFAEPIRFILAYAGADWKDNRIPFIGPGISPIPDDIKARTTFGQVPMLEFDGERLCQSFTIMRYLGRKFNLAGKDDLESAKVDEIGDGVRDHLMSFLPAFHETDESKKEQVIKGLVEAGKQKFLKKFNELVEKNGGYLVGKSLTWADISAVAFIDSVQRILNVQLLDSDLSALSRHFDTVINSTGIKEYIAQRPATIM